VIHNVVYKTITAVCTVMTLYTLHTLHILYVNDLPYNLRLFWQTMGPWNLCM